MKHVVQAINFLPDGSVSLQYTTPSVDVRQNGLIANHVLLIPDTDEYLDDLDLLRRQAERVLDGAIEDFKRAAPIDFDQLALGEDDDEPGPYDNPAERQVERTS